MSRSELKQYSPLIDIKFHNKTHRNSIDTQLWIRQTVYRSFSCARIRLNCVARHCPRNILASHAWLNALRHIPRKRIYRHFIHQKYNVTVSVRTYCSTWLDSYLAQTAAAAEADMMGCKPCDGTAAILRRRASLYEWRWSCCGWWCCSISTPINRRFSPSFINVFIVGFTPNLSAFYDEFGSLFEALTFKCWPTPFTDEIVEIYRSVSYLFSWHILGNSQLVWGFPTVLSRILVRMPLASNMITNSRIAKYPYCDMTDLFTFVGVIQIEIFAFWIFNPLRYVEWTYSSLHDSFVMAPMREKAIVLQLNSHLRCVW